MQAEYVFTRMNRVLKQVSTSLEETIEFSFTSEPAHVP